MSSQEHPHSFVNKVVPPQTSGLPPAILDQLSIVKADLDALPPEVQRILKVYEAALSSERKSYDLLAQRVEEDAKGAKQDLATGLPNLRAFKERGQAEFERVKRSQTPVTVVAIDLDGFKQINDRFGHPEGDRALQHFAEYFKDKFRTNDFIARTGGDEFSFLIEGTAETVVPKLNTLREAFTNQGYQTATGHMPYLSFSYGAHQMQVSDGNFEAAFNEADQGLLRNKKATKEIRYKEYLERHPTRDPQATTSLARQ